MSTRTELKEIDPTDLDYQDIEDDDYGFIIGPDGELKSLFMPEALPFKTPKNVQKILKLFGITDPHQLNDNTLH
jgi:hypothetical protein